MPLTTNMESPSISCVLTWKRNNKNKVVVSATHFYLEQIAPSPPGSLTFKGPSDGSSWQPRGVNTLYIWMVMDHYHEFEFSTNKISTIQKLPIISLKQLRQKRSFVNIEHSFSLHSRTPHGFGCRTATLQLSLFNACVNFLFSNHPIASVPFSAARQREPRQFPPFASRIQYLVDAACPLGRLCPPILPSHIWLVFNVGTTAGLPISCTLGRCHNFCCRGPILIPRPVLEIPAQTTRGNVLDFFVKPKNGISVSFTKRR